MAEKYYDTTEKKVRDFFIGFFLNIAIAGVIFFLFFVFVSLTFSVTTTQPSFTHSIFPIIIGILFIIGEFLLIRYFFKRRRYIAIGLLSSLILPLLVTGYCSTMSIIGVM